jgi:hypothetical protein
MKAPKLYARAKRIRAARLYKEEARSLEFDTEDADIYSVSGVEQLLDSDDISPEEAAFMEGYDEDE